jgi:hypothetical protein
MAENAGNRISEVQIFKFSRRSMPLKPPRLRVIHILYPPPTFEYASLSLHVLGLGAVIHFLVSKPAGFILIFRAQ